MPPEQVRESVEQYSRQWRIENQFKSIKEKPFLPTVVSMDYRVRFPYFVLGVIYILCGD